MVSVLNTVDTGHTDMIHGAEMDFYGLRLATCSSDYSVKIFDVRNGTQTLKATLKGHCGPVWQVSWAHPKFGSMLASCSSDRKVIVWKEESDWTKVYEYNGHDSSVNSVAWAPYEYGLMLACGSSDGSVSILYNLGDGNWHSVKILNAHIKGCNAVSWCPAIGCNPPLKPPRSTWPLDVPRRFVTGGCDNLVKIWKEDGNQWVEERKLECHSDWVRDVAWAPSYGFPHSTIASCSQDRRVIIWNSYDGLNWRPTILNVFDDVVWNVSWSRSAKILAVSGGKNKVCLFQEGIMNNEWNCLTDLSLKD